ncbi:MAG: gliding motility-associated C-terminal domain-containing protein [Bacteroidales bacterium]|nr:gliding motility-associated C-terminal domain-containing protein [Bacteroidales bacterium]
MSFNKRNNYRSDEYKTGYTGDFLHKCQWWQSVSLPEFYHDLFNYPAPPGSTYVWTLSGGGILSTTTGSNLADVDWTSLGGPNTLSVVETNANGCVGNPVNLNITATAPPTIITPLDTTGATNNQSNGSVTIMANGSAPLQYSLNGTSWSPTNNFTGLAGNQNYLVYVKDANGCITTEPFRINNILIGVLLDADTVTECPGSNVFLSVKASGMVNIQKFDICLTYDPSIAIFWGIDQVHSNLGQVNTDSGVLGQLVMNWTGSTAKSIPDGDILFRLEFKGKASGTSMLQWANFLPGICGITDNSGLPYIVSFSQEGAAVFRPQPTASILGDTTICQGNSLDLTSDGNFYQHMWTLPNGSQVPGQQYSIASAGMSDDGVYIVETTNNLGCTDKDTVNVSIKPGPQFQIALADTACADAVYQLEPGEGYASYEWWDFSTLPTNTATGEGVYWVKITDLYGCSNSDTLTLLYCPAAIYIPTAFSPNGDGKNEVFRARYSDVDILQDFKLLIYNRWGQLIFEGNSMDEAWDGYYNGVLCPDGVYSYFIRFTKPQGKTLREKSPIKGTVMLLR